MAIVLLDDDSDLDVASLDVRKLSIRRIDAAGEMLDACHSLLLSAFDPAVVDTKETYVDAVTDRSGTFRDFAPLFFAGLLELGTDELLAGFISSDLMLVGSEPQHLQLAIGNIATLPRLRQLGFRGVGTTLLQTALGAAAVDALAAGLPLRYSTSEAEAESLPFWAKRGYLWPEGFRYFQPPLEFDDQGSPIYPEVPETFVVKELTPGDGRIDAGELRELVRSIYWNWSIRPSLLRLDDRALARATDYVMTQVFERSLETLPDRGSIRLIPPPARGVHDL